MLQFVNFKTTYLQGGVVNTVVATAKARYNNRSTD